ncbi:MAG TPA: precorrin-6Y C5,15-methyltransferase (decarboxylating) subunit CbiT, partial [Desulfobacteraceae bacterium]|nr:precorrin-6Y C5,15-methyltransferase (decarboxylating) subunit CbiT [Desulfobacteraceae bacterium]
RPAPAASISPLGLSEAEISHSRGLITKDEVRAATLHRLGLPGTGVFWDVGAGSGSVSIEAARLCPGLHLFAVEKEEEQLANIRKNIARFETFNVQPVAGSAPAVLAGLPDPDRVFIGGSGGRLAEIIEVAAGRLQGAGRIVVNCVTGRTRKEAPELLHRHGCRVRMSELQISRHQNGGNNQWIDLNPITIVTGIK